MLVINDVVAVAWSPTWAPLVFFAALVVVLLDPAAGSVRPHGGAGPVSEPSVDRLRRGGPRRRRPPRRGPVIAGCDRRLALVALFPLVFTDPTTTSIAVFTLVFMVATSSWNIFSGYSGYLALGHAVFFGTGGYAVAMAARDWHVAGGWPVFALLPFGGLIAGLIAIPVGLIALRTRRHTFVVVTIAIFFIFQLAAFNLGFTGGTSGISCRSPRSRPATTTSPSTTWRAHPVATVALSWGCAARASGSSCWRSATTRTGRAASASRRGG